MLKWLKQNTIYTLAQQIFKCSGRLDLILIQPIVTNYDKISATVVAKNRTQDKK